MTDIHEGEMLAKQARSMTEGMPATGTVGVYASWLTQVALALEAQEAKITEALALHQPSERDDGLGGYLCEGCDSRWENCLTRRILSADAPTEPSPKASVSDTEDDSKLLSKFESSDPTEPAPVLERDPYEALVEGAANDALRHQPGTEGNGA